MTVGPEEVAVKLALASIRVAKPVAIPEGDAPPPLGCEKSISEPPAGVSLTV